MKRATSMLLLAAILTASASCGSTPSGNNDITDGQEQSTETTSGETTSPLYDLEKKDYGGKDFRISVCKKYEDEMWVEEENADVCNDAVYNRNLKVEDYLNVKIRAVTSDDSFVQVSDISKNLMAGDDVYDLTAVYTYLAGGPALQGFYYTWKDIPVVDFSKNISHSGKVSNDFSLFRRFCCINRCFRCSCGKFSIVHGVQAAIGFQAVAIGEKGDLPETHPVQPRTESKRPCRLTRAKPASKGSDRALSV